MILTRAQKNLIAALFTRHGRKKSPFCVGEGMRCVSEIISARPDLVEFIVAEKPDMLQTSLPYYLLASDEFAKISNTVSSQGILAVARTPDASKYADTIDDSFILALDRIADPGNFGTICRTARAANLHELWITEGTADPFGDKALRSGMGSQFGMNIRRFADLSTLAAAGKKQGFSHIFPAMPAGGENCFLLPELYDKSILVIGNEANGVTEMPENSRPVNIPMPGNFESLNAAQAATILIFEYVRRKFIQ